MNPSGSSFVLSTENVYGYLIERRLILKQEQAPQIERRDYKNFNLWLKLNDTSQYLVKQERFDWQGETSGDLAFEWRIQELLDQFEELSPLRSHLSELLFYDPERSILVARYFGGYEDLDHFYERMGEYPAAVAKSVGESIARVHRLTWHPRYQSFLGQFADGESIDNHPRLLSHIDTLGPGIFSRFSPENLEFFRIYQASPRMKPAVQALRQTWRPCCLIHRDLRLSNLVVQQAWAESLTSESVVSEQSFMLDPEPRVRIIDWEKFVWGDPAYDVGTLLAHYLRIWLHSLAIHRDLPLRQALPLATVPLEILQPSLRALVDGYLDEFPQVLQQYPDFLERVLRFTGMVLLEKVLLKLEHRHPFGNTDLCAMQVAQVALDQPARAAQQILGTEIVDASSSERAVIERAAPASAVA